MTARSIRVLKLLLYGTVTGIFCGIFVTLFLVCARIVCSFVFELYALERTPLVVVCILTLTVLCCFAAAVVQTLCADSRGSGIPLAEASARGMLKVKWLRTAAALAAGSILSFLAGMPLGSEGPSIGIGGLTGEGVGKLTNKPSEFRRYLITGGSSAGLAVAFNAPLTGVTFALEETHRRFSPGILLAALSSVIPAVLVSQLLFWAFSHNFYLYSLGIRQGAAVLPFLKQAEYTDIIPLLELCAVAALCGALTAALATAFNTVIFALGKLFGKIKSAWLRLLPAFLLTATVGLCLGNAVGTGEATFAETGVGTAAWLLFVLLTVRTVMTATASGAGATGGLFLPMIAIGGLFGTLAAKASVAVGIDEIYAPNIIMLCISAFFAASARAPISAAVMAVELTASFCNFLPCVIAVAVATAVAAAMKSPPLYERMMENLYSAAHTATAEKNVTATGVVPVDSFINGKRIRDILWPYNSLVTNLVRNDIDIVPDGETEILAGDKLTLRAENVTPEYFDEQLKDYIIQNLQ